MIQKILFSPIGKSDPINAGHDAGWLHCCRHFQPDLTVVYLSAEMMPRENEKKFFSKTLAKLSDHLGKKISFEKEERPSLDNPQDFEAFYDDFEGILNRYHNKYPDAQIFLNVSSGTPAMKGCLIHLYHMLPYKTQLIQVYGPHDEMVTMKGDRSAVSYDYDVDEGWELNLDNLPDAENRCHILRDQQQAIRLKILQLKTLIVNHQYSAALTLASDADIRNCLSDRLITALKGAVSRTQLDLKSAGMSFGEFDFDDGKIIRVHASELLFQGAEMLMTMELDLNADDIASALRKLTPVLFSLIIGCIKKNGMDLMSLMDDSQMFIDRVKMQASYPVQYSKIGSKVFFDSKFPDTAKVDSRSLLIIFDELADINTVEYKNIIELRRIERTVRNEIAHKPIKMTEQVFKKKTGMSSQEFIQLLKDTFSALDRQMYNKFYWQSYDRMKELILANLVIES